MGCLNRIRPCKFIWPRCHYSTSSLCYLKGYKSSRCEPIRNKSRCVKGGRRYWSEIVLPSLMEQLLWEIYCRILKHMRHSAGELIMALGYFFVLFSTWLPRAGYFPVEKRYRLWIQDPGREWTWRASEYKAIPISSQFCVASVLYYCVNSVLFGFVDLVLAGWSAIFHLCLFFQNFNARSFLIFLNWERSKYCKAHGHLCINWAIPVLRMLHLSRN